MEWNVDSSACLGNSTLALCTFLENSHLHRPFNPLTLGEIDKPGTFISPI